MRQCRMLSDMALVRLLTVFGKSEKADLSKKEVHYLVKAVKQIPKTYGV